MTASDNVQNPGHMFLGPPGMSASKLLVRLEERWAEGGEFAREPLLLWDAFPEIVAVVKAAELKPTHVYVRIPLADGSPSGRVRYPIVEALAALTRKLNEANE